MTSILSNLSTVAAEHATVLVLLALLSLVMLLVVSSRPPQDEPPALKEFIPFISNTYQYMVDLHSFTERASRQIGAANLLQFFLGPIRVYYAKGGKNVEAMFRKPTSITSERFSLMALERLDGFAKEDVKTLAADKSGRLSKPARGSEGIAAHQRYWAPMHEIYHSSLIQMKPSVHLAKVYNRYFSAALEEMPLGEWKEARLYDFLKRDMGKSACVTICGERCLEIEPSFVDKFWEFDDIAFQVVFGKPSWLDPRPTRIRDEWNQLNQRVLNESLSSFDWDGPDAQAEWEPTLGSRFVRSLVKFGLERGFSPQSIGGMVGGAVFAVNSNSIPITAWSMYEIIKDPDLYQAVRLEADSTIYKDQETGKKEFDIDKLLSMPLLQSIYTESLRLNVCINITREIVEPTELNGYKLRKGALLQAPTNLAHYDEQIWGKNGHKAAEFWPERHIKEVKKVDEATGKTVTVREFALAARPSEFFPYGGGVGMCSGRFFAKREIILTIAMLVSLFDMKFIEWTGMDGSKSDRGPLHNKRYFGAAAVPPDRDMKLRWRRRRQGSQ